MKMMTMFLLMAFGLALIGCSKDSEVESFISEWDSTTAEMVKKIDDNPTAAGVDDAQKVWLTKTRLANSKS